MHGFLRLVAFLIGVIRDTVVQAARAATALGLGMTREMIERTSLAWEERGWPDVGFLPVHSRWHYALIGGLLWILGYFLLRISLAILGLTTRIAGLVLARALHPICLPFTPLLFLFLVGAAIGSLAHRGVDDPLVW